MKVKHGLRMFLLLSSAIFWATLSAEADTVSKFTISGTGCLVLEAVPGCIAPTVGFAGDLVVDVTTGAVVSIDVLGFKSPSPCCGGVGVFRSPIGLGLDVANHFSIQILRLAVAAPNDSLVDFSGGILIPDVSGVFDTNNFQNFDILSGSITLEPSSFALMLLGVGLVFVLRKRNSRRNHLAT